MPQNESFFMKEIGIESERSKRARVMVERSNKVVTIRLSLHMVQGVGDIAMRVGGRGSMGGGRGGGGGEGGGGGGGGGEEGGGLQQNGSHESGGSPLRNLA